MNLMQREELLCTRYTEATSCCTSSVPWMTQITQNAINTQFNVQICHYSLFNAQSYMIYFNLPTANHCPLQFIQYTTYTLNAHSHATKHTYT